MDASDRSSKSASGVSAAPEAAPRERWEDPSVAPDTPADADGRPLDAIRSAFAGLGEVGAYAGHFLAAKFDGIKATFRNLGVYAALGVVGLIAGGAIISTAAVLLCVGIAWGLAILFGSDASGPRYWLGALVTGVLILGGLAGGIVFGMKALTNSSRKRTEAKYEARLRDQRERYGHDARERARQAEFIGKR